MYKVVYGVLLNWVVCQNVEGFLEVFVDVVCEFVVDGVDGIMINCGFLLLVQEELFCVVLVLVVIFLFYQVVMVNQLMLVGKCVGVLIIFGFILIQVYLDVVSVLDGMLIGIMEGLKEFIYVILDNELIMDVEVVCDDNIQVVFVMQVKYFELGGIVLECINMCFYVVDIIKVIGLLVWLMVSFVEWFQFGFVFW